MFLYFSRSASARSPTASAVHEPKARPILLKSNRRLRSNGVSRSRNAVALLCFLVCPFGERIAAISPPGLRNCRKIPRRPMKNNAITRKNSMNKRKIPRRFARGMNFLLCSCKRLHSLPFPLSYHLIAKALRLSPHLRNFDYYDNPMEK